jgi:hypothetical protein
MTEFIMYPNYGLRLLDSVKTEESLLQIEDPLKEICSMINSIPDTTTFMSCGGHWKPDRKSCCSSKINMIWIAIHSTNKDFREHMVKCGADDMGEWMGINRMDIHAHKCYLYHIYDAVNEYLDSMKYSIKIL